MGLRIEDLLRATKLSDSDKQLILRGIAQIAEADGVVDPTERDYLREFVTEFFPEGDPTDPTLTAKTITPEEVASMSSDDARLCLVAFLTIAGYVDGDFSEPERAFIRSVIGHTVPEDQFIEVQHGVRRYMYGRAVFAFALRNGFLHPDFAREMAERFDISYDEAIEINADVFNAVMAMKGAAGPQEEANG